MLLGDAALDLDLKSQTPELGCSYASFLYRNNIHSSTISTGLPKSVVLW